MAVRNYILAALLFVSAPAFALITGPALADTYMAISVTNQDIDADVCSGPNCADATLNDDRNNKTQAGAVFAAYRDLDAIDIGGEVIYSNGWGLGIGAQKRWGSFSLGATIGIQDENARAYLQGSIETQDAVSDDSATYVAVQARYKMLYLRYQVSEADHHFQRRDILARNPDGSVTFGGDLIADITTNRREAWIGLALPF